MVPSDSSIPPGVLRAFVEYSTELLAVVDSAGRHVFVNPAFVRLLGYSREELLGHDALTLVVEQERQLQTDTLRNLLEHPATTIQTRVQMRGKNGEVHVLDAIATNLIGVEGMDGIVVAARDVTEQVELQMEVERAKRIESLGAIAATVAHELRNALMGMKSFVELLDRQYPDHKFVIQSTDKMRQSIQRGGRIAEQILAFTRPARPLVKSVDLVKVVSSVVEEAKGQFAGIDLRVDGDVPLVLADEDQIHQAFVNVIFNAIEATGEGQPIEVCIAKKVEPDETGRKRHVEVSVTDRGPGVPEHILPRIFEPFFTTKVTGTGIGLAVAKEIVTAHGGMIRVESSGEGTTFRIVLPAQRAVA